MTVTNKYMTDPKLVHEAASGTMDIVRRMMQKEAAKMPFGIFGTVDAWKAYKGEADFRKALYQSARVVCKRAPTFTSLFRPIRPSNPMLTQKENGSAWVVPAAPRPILPTSCLSSTVCEERLQTILLHL